MRVAMQVLMALTATVLVLSAIVHLSGTADAIAQGLHTAPSSATHLSIRLEASSHPPDPTQSDVLKQIYKDLGTDITKSDLSDGAVHVKIAFEGKNIEDGSYVPMAKASSAPMVSVADDKGNEGFYTWILIDIDAPKPKDPSHSPFLHYILTNLDPSGRGTPTVAVSYYPVSPPEGEHRYIGLLFTQPKQADEDAMRRYQAKLGDNRGRFDVKDFFDHEGLEYVQRTYFYARPSHKTSDERQPKSAHFLLRAACNCCWSCCRSWTCETGSRRSSSLDNRRILSYRLANWTICCCVAESLAMWLVGICASLVSISCWSRGKMVGGNVAGVTGARGVVVDATARLVVSNSSIFCCVFLRASCTNGVDGNLFYSQSNKACENVLGTWIPTTPRTRRSWRYLSDSDRWRRCNFRGDVDGSAGSCSSSSWSSLNVRRAVTSGSSTWAC